MLETIRWAHNPMKKKAALGSATTLFSRDEILAAKKFHSSFPQYCPTPLCSLPCLAQQLGVAGIYIKDESCRFGLNAFKVLGGAYAIARYMAERLQRNINELSFAELASPHTKEKLGEITFVTTTDGNHGRGVAWTARQLGQKAVVYMPKGSSLYRLQAIRQEGAQAYITDLNYDDTVRFAADVARRYGWVVVQDTAWEGYQEIPAWIMQGYGTLAAEALEQLNTLNIAKPSHIFVQAGVGSLAGAVQGYFTDCFGQERPVMTIVEAAKADCFYQSVLAGDGHPHAVGGAMETIMAGLACGEPNILGWRILRDYGDFFAACPDWIAANGMRILGNPCGADPRIISGESGAVTLGLLHHLLTGENTQEIRSELVLNHQSVLLLFSTEGNTDPECYRNIVWHGECAAATCEHDTNFGNEMAGN